MLRNCSQTVRKLYHEINSELFTIRHHVPTNSSVGLSLKKYISQKVVKILTLTSPVLDSSLASLLWLASEAVSPLLWRPLESEEAEPLENAAPEDVERVMRGSKDPLDDEVASGDLGGCLALKGLVDLERFESKFRPTLEALDPRLKIGEKNCCNNQNNF